MNRNTWLKPCRGCCYIRYYCSEFKSANMEMQGEPVLVFKLQNEVAVLIILFCVKHVVLPKGIEERFNHNLFQWKTFSMLVSRNVCQIIFTNSLLEWGGEGCPIKMSQQWAAEEKGGDWWPPKQANEPAGERASGGREMRGGSPSSIFLSPESTNSLDMRKWRAARLDKPRWVIMNGSPAKRVSASSCKDCAFTDDPAAWVVPNILATY